MASLMIVAFRLERIFQSIKLNAKMLKDTNKFRLERIFQSIKLAGFFDA